ncbi:hypothetical protein M758_4G039800 [Ceratodon purpureus]|nr:hypothetical protein M758_4G039800 [Ceratodon purpureus]
MLTYALWDLVCNCRVALKFLREIRLKAQTDLDASRDHGRVFFSSVLCLWTSQSSARQVQPPPPQPNKRPRHHNIIARHLILPTHIAQ